MSLNVVRNGKEDSLVCQTNFLLLNAGLSLEKTAHFSLIETHQIYQNYYCTSLVLHYEATISRPINK